MGMLMKATMAKLAGKSADGKMVSEAVKSKLQWAAISKLPRSHLFWTRIGQIRRISADLKLQRFFFSC